MAPARGLIVSYVTESNDLSHSDVVLSRFKSLWDDAPPGGRWLYEGGVGSVWGVTAQFLDVLLQTLMYYCEASSTSRTVTHLPNMLTRKNTCSQYKKCNAVPTILHAEHAALQSPPIHTASVFFHSLFKTID